MKIVAKSDKGFLVRAWSPSYDLGSFTTDEILTPEGGKAVGRPFATPMVDMVQVIGAEQDDHAFQ